MRNILLTGCMAAMGMLVLILDAKTALAGAEEGLHLCLLTIIPSLFPFFVLSVLLTGSMAGIPSVLFRPLGRLCGIPEGSEILLLTGFLGGYPVGAQGVAQAWRNGQLNRHDAHRMLGFSSNAGPAFIFGIIGTHFSQMYVPWILWGIHILSALMTAYLLPGKSRSNATVSPKDIVSLPEAMERSLKISAGVCGWIILFRIVIAFCDRWFLWYLPENVQVAFYGALELANGCCRLSQIPDPGTRFMICTALLSFGGLCVTMQTVTATKGLGLGKYLPGKLLQCIISLTIAAGIRPLLFSEAESKPVNYHWLMIAAGLTFICIILSKLKKKVVAFPV